MLSARDNYLSVILQRLDDLESRIQQIPARDGIRKTPIRIDVTETVASVDDPEVGDVVVLKETMFGYSWMLVYGNGGVNATIWHDSVVGYVRKVLNQSTHTCVITILGDIDDEDNDSLDKGNDLYLDPRYGYHRVTFTKGYVDVEGESNRIWKVGYRRNGRLWWTGRVESIDPEFRVLWNFSTWNAALSYDSRELSETENPRLVQWNSTVPKIQGALYRCTERNITPGGVPIYEAMEILESSNAQEMAVKKLTVVEVGNLENGCMCAVTDRYDPGYWKQPLLATGPYPSDYHTGDIAEASTIPCRLIWGEDETPPVINVGDELVPMGWDDDYFYMKCVKAFGGNTTEPQEANTILAGPATGDDAAPTFRAMVFADLPTQVATSVLANATDAAAKPTELAAAADNVALLRLAGVLTFAQVPDAAIVGLGWTKITGKPTTFAPSVHTHPSTDISDLSTNIVTSIAMTAGEGIAHSDNTVAAKSGAITLDFFPFSNKGEMLYCDGNNPVNTGYRTTILSFPTAASRNALLVADATDGIPKWMKAIELGDNTNGGGTFKVYFAAGKYVSISATGVVTVFQSATAKVEINADAKVTITYPDSNVVEINEADFGSDTGKTVKLRKVDACDSTGSAGYRYVLCSDFFT